MSATSNLNAFRLGAALAALMCGPALGLGTNDIDGALRGAAGSEAQRIARLFAFAADQYQKHPTDDAAAWQFGRACFDSAELATNDTERAVLAREGIAACRQLTGRDPRSVAGFYYLGLDLGQLARTEIFGALRLVKEMEAALKTAITLDPRFDFAGPHRSLGLLYRDAPGWPASIGSRAKARVNLERAVELAPDYPDNRLCLLEACLAWGERNTAQAYLKPTGDALRKARATLTGEAWEAAWTDWESRFAKARAKAGEKAEKLRSPRDQ